MKYLEFEFRHRSGKFRETLERRIAWWLPRKIVQWAYIRVVAKATTGKWSNTEVTTLTAMDALKRWDEGNE